jgi:NAD(P)H-nitrite reductase large subunit
VRVDFFIRGERYWNRVLDEIESKIVQHRLKEEGVRVHLNTELARVLGRSGKVVGVETKDGRRFPTKMVGFAIGVRPRLGLAKASGIDFGRGIRVNPYLETSCPGIYAAGDVAEVYDPESGKWIVDSLWPVARHQGMVAGMNMAGKRQPYQRRSPMNVTRLTGVTTTIIGKVGTGEPEGDLSIVRGESQTWHQRPDAVVCQDQEDVNRLRVLVGEQKILGALLMGDQTLSRPLEELVAGEVDITPIRESITQPGADMSNIIMRYWHEWRKVNAH